MVTKKLSDSEITMINKILSVKREQVMYILIPGNHGNRDQQDNHGNQDID